MIEKLNFPSILSENEQAYFRYLEAVITSIDARAQTMASRRIDDVAFRIAPSSPNLFTPLLQDIKRFHTAIGVEVEFSKSMKTGANIFYCIKF